ncbi:acetyltransferase [Salinicola salarius]|uniref:acetyltransferase n=1 Tax=Salinicola salarius TaxID=430457 RepID=UPI000B3FE330|nr:acetyltransferase [Salinicola salarius]
MNETEALQLATKVQKACIEAALSGYENAALSGLCQEGAIKAAISAIQMLDLNALAVPGSHQDPT